MEADTPLDTENARKCDLYVQHPDESPEWIGKHNLYLIHPPSRLSSTAAWIAFRDKTVIPLMRMHPDDPNAPNFLKQVETILAWRGALAPQDHFWKKT